MWFSRSDLHPALNYPQIRMQTSVKPGSQGLDNVWSGVTVQWVRLYTSTAGSKGSIPSQGSKILHATWSGQKKKTLWSTNKNLTFSSLLFLTWGFVMLKIFNLHLPLIDTIGLLFPVVVTLENWCRSILLQKVQKQLCLEILTMSLSKLPSSGLKEVLWIKPFWVSGLCLTWKSLF